MNYRQYSVLVTYKSEVLSTLLAKLKGKYHSCSLLWLKQVSLCMVGKFVSFWGKSQWWHRENVFLWKTNTIPVSKSLFKPAAWWHRYLSRAAKASSWAGQTDLWVYHESSLCSAWWILPGWLCCPEWSIPQSCWQQWPPQFQNHKDQTHGWGQTGFCTGAVAFAPHLSKRSMCDQKRNLSVNFLLLPTKWHTHKHIT